ncbi:MAG: hypothetical protein AB8I08_09775 [Sandaracinaceae bacterium]
MQTQEVFDLPIDGSEAAVIRSPEVLPADVGSVRPAGGRATDQRGGIDGGEGGGPVD